MLRVLTERGFAPLEAQYTDSWLHSGQQVRRAQAARRTRRRCWKLWYRVVEPVNPKAMRQQLEAARAPRLSSPEPWNAKGAAVGRVQCAAEASSRV